VPAEVTPVMFTCARTAGWSAHIMEQKLTGRLIRPSARYVGPGPRLVRDVPGADEMLGG
jgi:citrate synthase